jgi:hypothetical protein
MIDLQAGLEVHQSAAAKGDPENLQPKRLWISLPVGPRQIHHRHHLYTVLIEQARTGISRYSFFEVMTAAHILAGVHYSTLPERSVNRNMFCWWPEDYSSVTQTGWQFSQQLSGKLIENQVSRVIDAPVRSAKRKEQRAKNRRAKAQAPKATCQRLPRYLAWLFLRPLLVTLS